VTETTGRMVQVTTFASEAAAASWRKYAAARDAYMAATTNRLLDMAGVGIGSRVLSLGVGTGGEAFEAAKRVGPSGHVVATDLSPAMVAGAQAEAAAVGITNIEFRVMDAQHLDFPDGAFDAVTSRNVLMFVPDLAGALAEIKRVLRSPGRVGASVWSTGRRNPRIADPLVAARVLGAHVPGSATYQLAMRLARPSVLRVALSQAGFTHIQQQLVPLVAEYLSLDDAVDTAMDQPPTAELVALLGADGDARMRRALKRRWAKYGAHLPGEQLVVGGAV